MSNIINMVKINPIAFKERINLYNPLWYANHLSNDDKKYGALLGAGCGLIESIMTAGKFKPIGLLNMIPMAIGGLIMGAITDHYTNSSAKKNA